MIALQGEKAELRFTLEITRAATGKVETVEMIGHADKEVLDQLIKEQQDGSHTQHSGA